MCGIFGMVIRDPSLSLAALQRDLCLLFELTEPRGRQAAGVALYRGGTISTYKQPETASKMIARPGFRRFLEAAFTDNGRDATAFVGHCRLVTDGSELDQANNHPLQVDHIVGVHNGVMNNFQRLRRAVTRKTTGETDTEVFFGLLADQLQETPDPRVAVSKTYGKLIGSASIGFLTAHMPILGIATNFGSLYYTASQSEGFIAFASERLILDRFLSKRQGDTPKVVKVAVNTGAIIGFDDIEPVFFDLDKGALHAGADPDPASERIQPVPDYRVDNPFPVIDRRPSPAGLRRCTRCILPENYPFLTFDADGVCSHCTKYIRQKVHGKAALEQLLSKYRSNNGEVDCVVGLSGGRDSSYGLHLLKNEFGMHPVGMSYDWLLTSRKARHNIAKIAGALGVEVIYRCGDYERQAENIRKNIYAFLEDPDLGMMTFVQAGDKEMYHYGREVREELGVGLTVWCSGYQLEQREFFIGYCGIDKTLRNNPRLYNYGWGTKLRLAAYYGLRTLRSPGYINTAIVDNAMAFWHCFVAKDDFLYLFGYYPWSEAEVERVLRDEYQWEADADYGENQWRMDDFHTSFINYVYYTVGGFSEFDDFRANQVREGLIDREEALRLAAIDNVARLESLRQFAALVGINLEHVLKRIDAIPKLY